MANSYDRRFVPLMSDAGFKAVFRCEGNKELLIGLLNLLLPEEALVEDIVEYCDREQEVERANDKRTVLDLICKGKDGSHYIVEVQRQHYNDFFERLIFYAAKRYASQLHTREGYESLRPVYVLNILDHKLKHQDEDMWGQDNLISHYEYRERRTKESIAVPTIIVTFVEMPRFNKKAEECRSELDCLLYWFRHCGELDMIPEIISKSTFASRLANATEFAAMTDVQKNKYDSDMINEMDREYQMRQNYKMGLEEGREEGMQVGKEEGRADERLKIASNMKEQGFAAELIAKVTGLTIEQIAQLK